MQDKIEEYIKTILSFSIDTSIGLIHLLAIIYLSALMTTENSLKESFSIFAADPLEITKSLLALTCLFAICNTLGQIIRKIYKKL